jgi:hypothetical protein
MDCRGRLEGIDKDLAGNYVTALVNARAPRNCAFNHETDTCEHKLFYTLAFRTLPRRKESAKGTGTA